MTSVYILLGIFIVIVGILSFLKDRIDKTIHCIGYRIFRNNKWSVYVYFMLFLPGIILHELSHLLAAGFLRVPTGEIKIFPEKIEETKYQLGYVKTVKTNPFKECIIGSAPFLVGLIIILCIIKFTLQLPFGLFQISHLLTVGENFLIVTPVLNVVLGCYGIFIIGNTMFLSESDKRNWMIIPICGLVIGSIIYYLGFIQGSTYVTLTEITLEYLISAFTFICIVDLVFLLPFGMINYIFLNKK